MENTSTYSQLTCLKFRYMAALCVPAYIWIKVNSLQLSLGLIKKSVGKKKMVRSSQYHPLIARFPAARLRSD